jgi:hypothetical protein
MQMARKSQEGLSCAASNKELTEEGLGNNPSLVPSEEA